MSQLTGQHLIAAERQRQISSEGWTQEHDDEHGAETLELAAVSYRDAVGEDSAQPAQWPWEPKWWKPKSRLRNLVRAGALYQAASEVADHAGDYQRRDTLREHVASCSHLLDSIHPTNQPVVKASTLHCYLVGDHDYYAANSALEAEQLHLDQNELEEVDRESAQLVLGALLDKPWQDENNPGVAAGTLREWLAEASAPGWLSGTE